MPYIKNMNCDKASELIESLRSFILSEYRDFNIKVGDKLGKHKIVAINKDKEGNLILITDL